MSLTKTISLFLNIFHLLSVTTLAITNSSAISYEVPNFIRVYENGTVQRLFGTKTVPASLDPKTRVQSKDIQISPNPDITARLYLPENATSSSTKKLPLLVYYHGGGFLTESAFSPTYHNHLNSLVAKANVVALSVNYRLAPETPLPAGYQDSWRALEWVFSHDHHINNESWIEKYVDLGKVHVAGDSAGGNIAHNMAMRAGLDDTARVVLSGMILNFPHFWGVERIGNELGYPEVDRDMIEGIWVHAYPNSMGFDDPSSNPGKDLNISKLGCKRVLVYVGEKDILRDRGFYYGEVLKGSDQWNGDVEVVEVKGVGHVFYLNSPDSEKAKAMLSHLASFLNDQP